MKTLMIIAAAVLTTFAGERCETGEQDTLIPDYKTTYAAFGGMYTDMDNMNSALQNGGAPTLDNAVFQFSFGENSHYGQFLLGGMFTANIWRIAENTNKRSLQGTFDFSAIAGYDLVESDRTALYPYAGIGFGWIIHHRALKDEPYESIIAGESVQDETLWQMSLDLKTGVGFDFRAKESTDSPVFGVRLGYNFDVSNGSRWYRGFSTVSHAPSFKKSGPFAELVFGFASKNQSEDE